MLETTLVKYFTKVTLRLSYTRLRIIEGINRVYEISKWKICYKESAVSPYSNLLGEKQDLSEVIFHLRWYYIRI